MRVVVLVLVAFVVAGCASEPDTQGPDPSAPLHASQPGAVAGEPGRVPMLYTDPWGNLTQMLVLQGAVNWHDDPNTVGNTGDRVTQPVAHPCTFQGQIYFNNVWLGAASVWNFTARLEVVLEWDPLSYTRDMLRVGYDTGDDGWRDSDAARSGQPIVIPVTPAMWDPDPIQPGEFGGNIPLAACIDEDNPGSGVPPYFEGELRFKATAFRMPSAAE